MSASALSNKVNDSKKKYIFPQDDKGMFFIGIR